MHFSLSLSCAIALLISARSTLALPSASGDPFETFVVLGNATLEHVQQLYDQLGGTFITPFLLPDGTNVSVTGLELRLPNTTGTHDATNLELAETADPGNGSAVSRRAPAFQSSYTCSIPGQFGDQFVGPELQYFLNVKLCNFINDLQPYVYAYAAIYIDKLPCGPLNKRTCQGIYAVSGYKVGDTIGKKVQAYCANIYSQMQSACGDNGGTAATTIAGGGKFLVESFQTTETADVCPSTADEVGKVDCATIACNSQCTSLSKPAGTAHAKREISSSIIAVQAMPTLVPAAQW